MNPPPNTLAWLLSLNEVIPQFLEKLQVPGTKGRYRLCLRGATAVGESVALGFSCFALKILHTLDLFDQQSASDKEAWLSFIRAFQVEQEPQNRLSGQGAFVDPAVMDNLPPENLSLIARLRRRFADRSSLSAHEQVMVAETKQAIATLAQENSTPLIPYRGYPRTLEEVKRRMHSFDWNKPWGAGGQTAALVVFIVTQTPTLASPETCHALTALCRTFFRQIAHKENGCYFKGDTPNHGQLTNGAMKVLTALDWLAEPVHYPEKLIDTVLAQEPVAKGCNLVDAVYVLHRCLKQTHYRHRDAQEYCLRMVEMIRGHHRSDGGFSYEANKSQTAYYGVTITNGELVGDLHGTCLLTWALAMIFEILEVNPMSNWRVIRP